jgi:hypothetical protein
MTMNVNQFRFVIDPLYGRLSLDNFLASLILQPEVQRLRQVRLSNINSFLLPGCAGISRFEHSLGTAYLAQQVAINLSLPIKDRLCLECAALLHDVAITPFGHLMEEAFRYAGMSFDHERRIEEIFLGEKEIGNIDLQIFKGRTVGFRKVLNYKEYLSSGITAESVFALKRGEGALGQMINGTIDLDNIDNVSRMAHHIGIDFRPGLPLELSKAFFVRDNILCYDGARIELVEEWMKLRERLYSILMTNPFDFSAKSMLLEAIRIGLTGTTVCKPALSESQWKLTDDELLQILGEYPPTRNLIDRLQTGHLFNFIGLFWVDSTNVPRTSLSPENVWTLRKDLAIRLKCDVDDFVIYLIRDKRSRRIDNISFRDRYNQGLQLDVSLGQSSPLVLVGICSGLQELITSGNEAVCKDFLEAMAGKGAAQVCEPGEELEQALKPSKKENGQLGLFLSPTE